MKAIKYLVSAAALVAATNASAAQIPGLWNSWTQLDTGYDHKGNIEDRDFSNGGSYVDPGWGGQNFDAEYLFYKLNGTTLSVGLQTGFDLLDGRVKYSEKNYFAGDLALSFDGDNSSYEFAIDFGYLTKDYWNNTVGGYTGVNAQGLYSVDEWNTNIAFPVSSPFAMDEGSLIAGGANRTGAGLYGSGSSRSYFIQYDIDLLTLGGLVDLSNFGFGAHWTMSCGNDAIDGTVNLSAVPLPPAVVLMGFGLAGLGALRRKANAKKA